MTTIGKLYTRLLANHRVALSFRDFERLLRAFGFEHDRTVGSHRQYVHAAVPRPFPCSRAARMPSPIKSASSSLWSTSTAWAWNNDRSSLSHQHHVV